MVKPSSPVCRITSFGRFQEEFKNRALSFVTYDVWEDAAEGPLLRALAEGDLRKDIKQWLETRSNELGDAEANMATLVALRKSVHMQSWSAQQENSLMWGAYGDPGPRVRIATTREKIAQLGGVTALKIDYKSIRLKDELARVFKRGKIRYAEVFRTKRKGLFQDERELRLMTSIDLQSAQKTNGIHGLPPSVVKAALQSFVDTQEMPREEQNEVVNSWLRDHCVKLVPFGHIDNFIEWVQVGPRESDEAVADVAKFCAENGLSFIGKSDMLQFKLSKP